MACNQKKEVLAFPRRYRLSRRVGFSQILQRRPQTSTWFAVHSELNSVGHARLGMSVSKRVLSAATRRNSAKRLIRECFRNYARLGVALDIVIRLRKSLKREEFPAARIELSKILKTVLAAK